jgi:hypothetical protein
MLENQLFVLTFLYSFAILHSFIFLASVKGVIILNIVGLMLNFSGKNYSLAFNVVDMDIG